MSNVARHVIHGDAAWLIVQQARKVAENSGKTIYQIYNDPLELAVYDSRAQTLVVFDSASLVAIASNEVAKHGPVEKTAGIEVQA